MNAFERFGIYNKKCKNIDIFSTSFRLFGKKQMKRKHIIDRGSLYENHTQKKRQFSAFAADAVLCVLRRADNGIGLN